jgi:hypothetical protein
MRTACLLAILIRSDLFHPHLGGIYSARKKRSNPYKYMKCFSHIRSSHPLSSMRRLPIIQRPSFLRLRAIPLVHRPIFLVATRHQSFSVMSQKKHQASPDSSSQPDGNNEPLPPLSPKDFRTYNRMAEQMDQFVRAPTPIILPH